MDEKAKREEQSICDKQSTGSLLRSRLAYNARWAGWRKVDEWEQLERASTRRGGKRFIIRKFQWGKEKQLEVNLISVAISSNRVLTSRSPMMAAGVPCLTVFGLLKDSAVPTS